MILLVMYRSGIRIYIARTPIENTSVTTLIIIFALYIFIFKG